MAVYFSSVGFRPSGKFSSGFILRSSSFGFGTIVDMFSRTTRLRNSSEAVKWSRIARRGCAVALRKKEYSRV